MPDILTVIAPIFLLIGIGYASVRLGYFARAGLPVLGAMVIRFALPALIFKSLSQRSPAEVLNGRYLAAYAAASLATLALGIAWARLARNQRLDAAAIYGMGMSCANSAFMGYPIALQVVGPIASLALALTMMVENLLMLPLCIALAECSSSGSERFLTALGRSFLGLRRNPIIVAITLGLGAALLSLHLPPAAARAVDLLASASAPAALLFIGGSLVGMPIRSVLGDVTVVAAGKLLLHPLLVLAAVLALAPIDPVLAMAAVLIAGMPMLSIFPILGQKHGLEGFCAATLVAATVASFLTIGASLWLLQTSGVFAVVR
jgi:hypothetical protein